MTLFPRLTKKVQKFSFIDIKLLGLAAFFLGLLFARLIPALRDVNPWTYFGLFIIAIFKPLVRYFFKS